MSKSIKYDNFVYLTICEASFDLFKESNCMTYQNYCNLFKFSIQDGKLSKKEMSDIAFIIKFVDKVFSMDYETTAMYVKNFFILEKYKKFEMPVRYTLEFYPFSTVL